MRPGGGRSGAHGRQRRPWDVLARSLAGGVGGYGLAQVLPVALVAPWPLARADAALIALQLSFAVYAGAVLWAFAARSAGRAWAGIALMALAAGAVAWLVTP